MTPAPSFRVRFAVASIFAMLGLAFLVSPGSAQPLRGRSIRGGEVYSFSCGKCGADLGTHTSPFGPPGLRTCPRCGVRLVGTKDAPNPSTNTPDNRGTLILGLIAAGVLTLGVIALVLLIVLVRMIGRKSSVEGTHRERPDDREERRPRDRSRRSRHELE